MVKIMLCVLAVFLIGVGGMTLHNSMVESAAEEAEAMTEMECRLLTIAIFTAVSEGKLTPDEATKWLNSRGDYETN